MLIKKACILKIFLLYARVREPAEILSPTRKVGPDLAWGVTQKIKNLGGLSGLGSAIYVPPSKKLKKLKKSKEFFTRILQEIFNNFLI
jgi:hypothetical protein